MQRMRIAALATFLVVAAFLAGCAAPDDRTGGTGTGSGTDATNCPPGTSTDGGPGSSGGTTPTGGTNAPSMEAPYGTDGPATPTGASDAPRSAFLAVGPGSGGW